VSKRADGRSPIHPVIESSIEKLRRKIERAYSDVEEISSKTQEIIAGSRDAMSKADAALANGKKDT
jgi:uncharacterized protein DUF3359